MKILKSESIKIHILALIAAITALCLLPFINKAFHMDDTVFLWIAEQIVKNPFNFYGFTANWNGFELPMHYINQNPPLLSYYIAAMAQLFGWSETGLHVAFLMPAIFLSIGVYVLASFFCPLSYLAALIAILTPVFLVSSSNIMADTFMLAFYVWAIVFWVYGIKKDRAVFYLFSGLLISFAALTKYIGMSVIPLLFVYSLAEKRTVGVWALFLTIPVIILGLYQILTLMLYDEALIFGAISYAANSEKEDIARMIFIKILTGLSFTGGSFAGLLFFIHLLWPRRIIVIGATGLLIVCVAHFVLRPEGIMLFQHSQVIQFYLFVFLGTQVLILSLSDLLTHKTSNSLLLFCWIFGIFFFSSYFNWTTNGRSIFPMAPAVGILVVRRINERFDLTEPLRIKKFVWPLFPAAAIALAVTWADTTLANNQRSAARIVHERLGGHTQPIWFQGHWGFQYYMESYGAQPVDFKNSTIKNGDVIVIPTNNASCWFVPQKHHRYLGTLQLKKCRWLATMSKKYSAGFYSGIFGFLPFYFGRIEPEEYLIYLVSDRSSGAETEVFRK